KRQVTKRQALQFDLTKDDVLAQLKAIDAPDWLKQQRLAAWDHYQATPFPTTSDEPWRRTDIHSMPTGDMHATPAEDIQVDPDLLTPLVGDERGALLINRPGKDPIWESPLAEDESGVIFTDWATALRQHGDLIEKHLGSVVADDEGKFSALAAAMANEGTFVYIPAGVKFDQPLHAVFWAPGGNKLFFSRTLVVIEDGASATFILETASPTSDQGDSAHAGIVEIKVGKNAHFQFVELQNLGRHAWSFTHERASVEQDGNLDWIFGAVGSKVTKNFTDLVLDGRGSQGRMSGFYFADGTQHFDHDTQQNHMAADTTSDLLFKGGLINQSRSVWQGMIYVAPGAQKTDGYQANRNLILSSKARADSIPGLEILADDVRCTHGATVGQLEEEPIFYLMSRGVPRAQAERIVIDGFFTPIMDRIPFDGVQERFKAMIDAKLEKRT
ncbi:MAG: Fe-S cluster assembly protein SufD, partial [Anaerolineales bacterium]